MRTCSRKYSILLLLMLGSLTALAQSIDTTYYKPNKIYFMGEVEGGISDLDFGALAGFSILLNKHILSYSVIRADEIRLDNNSDYNQSNNLMYGRRIFARRFNNISVSTGISYVKFKRRIEESFNYKTLEYQFTKISTVGFPIQVKYWNNSLWRYMGGSVALNGNLNTKNSFFTLTLGIMVGNTREKRPPNE